jgi:hypothetical protein
MNQHLAKAAQIYDKDFHKLLYWHLCFGVVVSDADSFAMCFYSQDESQDQACEIHHSNTLFVTMCAGDMRKALRKFRNDFEYIAFRREFKNSPRIRSYDMQQFYSKLK